MVNTLISGFSSKLSEDFFYYLQMPKSPIGLNELFPMSSVCCWEL